MLASNIGRCLTKAAASQQYEVKNISDKLPRS